MKLKAMYFLAGLIIAVPITSWSQEAEMLDKEQQLPFSQRVVIEARQKNEALKEKIRNMSNEEYRSYIHERTDKAFSGLTLSDQQEVILVIDTTDKMTESKQLYTNQNILSASLAIQKLQSLLTPLNRGTTIDFNSFQTMSSKLSAENQTVRQIIRGMLEYQDVKHLIDQEGVLDVHVNHKGANSIGGYMMEIHEHTGRIMPLREKPEEDAKIMNDGWFQELIDTFENDTEKRTGVVFLMDKDIEAVKKFKMDWEHKGIEFGKMRSWFIYAYTTKGNIKAMKTDPRVRTIRLPVRVISGSR